MSLRVAFPGPLELLRHPDRDHPGPAVALGRFQVGPDHVDLPVALAEPDPRDAVRLGIPRHGLPERVADLAQRRRGRDRETPVMQEPDHLPAGLQNWHVSVEVDPVQALDIEHRMPSRMSDNVTGRFIPATSQHNGYKVMVNRPARSRQPSRPPRRSEAEPHWYTYSWCTFRSRVEDIPFFSAAS